MKLIYLILFIFILSNCNKESKEPILEMEAYIVGFAPCTIQHHYRIGFVIVSKDLKDTLTTYNLSDEEFKMPASVLLNSSDTLYKIPESYFQNYKSSPFFPIEARNEFKINITFKYATEEEKTYYVCTTDILFLNFPQIIIASVTKY